MTYSDPFGRRYRPAQPSQQAKANTHYQANPRSGGGPPTLEDFHRLSEAYQSIQAQWQESQAQLEATQEALRQQTKSAMDFQDQLKLAYQQLEQMTQERDEANAVALARQNEATELRIETTNYRTRLEQRLGREADEKRLVVLRDMLSLADHLELAITYWDQNAGSESDIGFRSNLVAIRDAFLDTLRRHGVQPQQPVGEIFHPEQHEALGQIVSGEIPVDRVALVVRTGYTADEQLLRPARVMVSSGAVSEGG